MRLEGPAALRERPDLVGMEGYHSASPPARVRLNANEPPGPPPSAWRDELLSELAGIDPRRYPDPRAQELRAALARYHGVGEDEVFCANGSNEVLQVLLIAFGGHERRAALFWPTYALHQRIARLSATPVVLGPRDASFAIETAVATDLLREAQPAITFLCSPNNPTGAVDELPTIEALLSAAPGLLVVDEAYAPFSDQDAFGLRGHCDARRLVLVRTFSKAWALAGFRLGYCIAAPEVVAVLERVALPYHLDVATQLAGRLALRHEAALAGQVRSVVRERSRLASQLADLPVRQWPSQANFILFRPEVRPARSVWEQLVERSVLVRDVSRSPGVEGCLRVTVGTPGENNAFLGALRESL